MNVIELHSWNAIQPDLEHPDRFVLDLDPDEKLSWRMMTEAAQLAKVLLDEIGLHSFLKTSGGKGYHVVIPVTRRQDEGVFQGGRPAYGADDAGPVFSSPRPEKPRRQDFYRLFAQQQRREHRCGILRARQVGAWGIDAGCMG